MIVLARLGEPQPTVAAQKEPASEPLLEETNLLADGTGRDAQRMRRAGNVQMPSSHFEGAKGIKGRELIVQSQYP